MDPSKSPVDILWVIIAAGLIFLMQAGFTCLESGLTRAKNSINVAVKNLTDLGVCVILFWAFGFALMFGASNWPGPPVGWRLWRWAGPSAAAPKWNCRSMDRWPGWWPSLPAATASP
jgi:ammonia channel protein AmtB